MTINFPDNKPPVHSKKTPPPDLHPTGKKMVKMGEKISDAPRLELNREQKRTYVLFLLGYQFPDTIREFIALRNAGNIESLVNEIPELFPDRTAQKQKEMKKNLIKEWIKLIVGQEWGVGILFKISQLKVGSEGTTPGRATFLGAHLITEFNDSKESEGILSAEALKQVEQGFIAGAEATNATNRAYFELNRSVTNPEGKNSKAGEILSETLHKHGIITIPTGWYEHGVGLTIHRAKDGNHYLYYCNRGSEGFEKAEDRAIMNRGTGAECCDMICWKIGRPEILSPELITRIISMLWLGHSNRKAQDKMAKPFLEGKEGIFKILELKDPISIPKKMQKIGNCSWANYKGSMHGAFIAAAFDQMYQENPGVLMRSAIERGTEIFKRMERFGRELDLQYLLAYDARKNPGLLGEFDHLRILRAEVQKLTTKIGEERNHPHIREKDQSMKDQIMAYIKDCPYEIRTLTHALQPDLEFNLLTQLCKAEEGAYTFVNGNCYLFSHGKLHAFPIPDGHEPLKSFVERVIPESTTPFFFEGCDKLSQNAFLKMRKRFAQPYEYIESRLKEMGQSFEAEWTKLFARSGSEDFGILHGLAQKLIASPSYHHLKKHPDYENMCLALENLLADTEHNVYTDQLYADSFVQLYKELDPQVIKSSLDMLKQVGYYVAERGVPMKGTPLRWRENMARVEAKLALLSPASISSLNLQEANERLNGQPVGSWMIRKSMQPGLLTISYVNNERKVEHHRIQALNFLSKDQIDLNNSFIVLDLKKKV